MTALLDIGEKVVTSINKKNGLTSQKKKKQTGMCACDHKYLKDNLPLKS